MKRNIRILAGVAVLLVLAVGVWLIGRSAGNTDRRASVARAGARQSPSLAVANAGAPGEQRVSVAQATNALSDLSDASDRADRSAAPAIPTTPAAALQPSAPRTAANEGIVEPVTGGVTNRYADNETLDERVGPVDAAGRYERVRVVKTDMKYPLVRVVETWRGDTLISQTAMVADHVMLKVNEGVSEADLAAYAKTQDGKILRKLRIPGPGAYLVKFDNVTVDTVPRALAALGREAGLVAHAQPDLVAHILETIPNDPRFGDLWGMKNTGQTLAGAPRQPNPGTPGCDIKATEAWELSTGSRDVLVAVIDTGIDSTHPDLAANMWNNPGETGLDAFGADKRTNGIDDDGNGYIDDWRGWDFYNEDNDPFDDHGHGTHCAGTIGGVGNNGVGVAGVCWNVSLVGLKFLSGSGGTFSDAAEATYYATSIGVKLTSNSWGGRSNDSFKSDPNDLMRQAILDAGAHGILFVAAAGNTPTVDNDGKENISYPASYDCDNIVAVAATDAADGLASFSCYGATTVDLGAPGVNILSSIPGNKYEFYAGTSMATPHVAGACALIASVAVDWTAAQIKAHLLASVDPIPSLAGKCVTGGRLNIGRAALSDDPLLRWSRTQLSDAADGNDDGLANPGETVELTVTLRNVSRHTIAGVNATLTCEDDYITVTDSGAAFGEVAELEEKTALDALAIAIAPECPTPREVTLTLAIADSGSGAWTNTFTVMVYTSYQVSGTVTLDGAPAAGVTVAWQGPLSGSRVTDAEGGYRFGAIAGTNAVTARKEGWLATLPVNVTLPPTVTNVNFAFTNATVSGVVTDGLTGAAMSGVTVSYGGDLTGEAVTGADGRYAFTRVYGRTASLTLTARKAGYFDETRDVTVPPDAVADFSMGYSDIDVTPRSFVVTGTMGETLTRTLTLENRGTRELTYTINAPGKVLRHFGAPTHYLTTDGCAYDGEEFWVLGNSYDPDIRGLTRFDALSGANLGKGNITGTLGTGTHYGIGLAWHEGNLWVTTYDPLSDRPYIHAMNPRTYHTDLNLPVTNMYHYLKLLAFGGGGLWVKGTPQAEYPKTETAVCKLDPFGVELNRWIVPADPDLKLNSIYSGLVYMNGAIWMGAYGCGLGGDPDETGWQAIHKLDPETGQPLDSFTVKLGNGAFIHGMSKAGSRSMWVLASEGEIPFWWGEMFLVDIGDEPWMSEDPRVGAVPGLSNQTVTLTFDTVAAGLGTHESYYRIESNDPDQPEVMVPVTFTVLADPANRAPVIAEGAEVNVTMSENGAPTPFSLTLHATDADGDSLEWSVADAASPGLALAWGVGGSVPVNYVTPTNYCGADRFEVRVSDGRGAAATIVVNVTIQGINQAPTVTATATPMSGYAPLTAAFTACGEDIDGDPLTYSWDFGDGSTSSPQVAGTASHVFTNPGVYAVTVTARDPGGLTASASLTVAAWASGGSETNLVYGWGLNDYGQLGDGTTLDRWLPVPASLIDKGIAVAAGFGHSAVFRSDGVYLWGYNLAGQLGDGTTTDRLTPALSLGFADFADLKISCNGFHTVALMSDGTVRTCGLNRYGQLGDGTTVDRLTPVAVKLATGVLLDRVVAISPGYAHTLALKDDGTVWAWGYNDDGQLGDNSNLNRSNPVQVQNLTGVMAIAGGTWHSLALKNDGTVWAWGDNSRGQIGDGTRGTDRLTPVQVQGLANVVAIAGGALHSIALGNDGAVWAWGRNTLGQCGSGGTSQYILTPSRVTQGDSDDPLANVVAIAAGSEHNVALKNDGRVWAWGYNGNGECGTGSAGTLTRAMQVPGIAAVTSIAAGRKHTLAIVNGGRIVTDAGDVSVPEGGTATFGVRLARAPAADTVVTVTRTGGDTDITAQSGDSLTFTPDNWDTFQTVTLAAAEDADADNGKAVFALNAGADWSVACVTAIEVENDAWVRAFATPGGSVTPVNRTLVGQGVALAIEAVPDAGYAFVNWTPVTGTPTFGDADAASTTVTLGDDAPMASPYTQVRANFVATDTVLQINAGPNGTVSPAGRNIVPIGVPVAVSARANAGYVFSRWVCSAGSAVFDNWLDANTTVTVTAPATIRAQFIVAGQGLAAWACGRNDEGQLGDGSQTLRANLVQVMQGDSPLTNIVAMAGGLDHSAALRSDGRVLTWGKNDCGQLGDGTTDGRLNPAPVPDLADVMAVSAGDDFTMALKTNGTVWVWGRNHMGQLGNGTTNNSGIPLQVAVSNVTGIAAGGDYALVLGSDGAVWGWGRNEWGSVGNGVAGAGELQLVPAQALISNVVAIAASGLNSAGLCEDGTVWLWGIGGGMALEAPYAPAPSALSNALAIAAGDCHTLALRADGTVWGVGSQNPYGQLGDGTSGTEPRYVPAQALISNVVAIAANGGTSRAIGSDGSLWAWGRNDSGQLGNGESGDLTVFETAPAQAPGARDYVAVAGGGSHTLALQQVQPQIAVTTDETAVPVPEGGTNTFRARLSAQPWGDVTLTVVRESGDPDIAALGGMLTFTEANWDTYQTITLVAARDADVTNGTAVIRLSGADSDATVLATEVELATYGIAVQVTGDGSVTPLPVAGAITVAAGESIDVVLTADQWRRIATLAVDGASVDAAGLVVCTQTFENVSSAHTLDVVFVTATPQQTGVGVPSDWARQYYATEAAAAADGDIRTDYLLGLIPTNGYDIAFAIAAIAIDSDGEKCTITVRLTNGGDPLSAALNGALNLYGRDSLVSGGWDLVGEAPQAQFDGNGEKKVTFPETLRFRFYRAVIE